MTKIYVRLHVYDYDLDSRHRVIKHICKDEQQAKHLVQRLESLNPGAFGPNDRTGGWLQRNHGIYGFITKVEGIFEETTRRIA